jgi:spore maturation protein CgeB
MYEATGVGSCLVTDWKRNLGDLFDADEEVVTYRTPEECADKVRYLLRHDELRNKIARAGQVRTHRDHSLAASLRQFTSDFESSYPG